MVTLDNYFTKARQLRRNSQPLSKVAESTEEVNRLVEANLPLVVSIIRRTLGRKYVGRIEDLIQEGNIGLIETARRYDPSRGYRFSTYAEWWVKCYILKSLAKDRLMQIDEYGVHIQMTVFRIIDDLTAKKKERPTYEEIADGLNKKIKAGKNKKLKYTARDVEVIIDSHYTLRSEVFSLDSDEHPGFNNNHIPPLATPPDQFDRTHQTELRELICSYLWLLSETERAVIKRIYCDEAKIPDIAKELGISTKVARSLQYRSISRLRTAMSYDKRVKSFL